MIFEEVSIYNLFCYYGKVTFDLKSPKDDCNIALIYGRNGYGKTSFINSIKLLFGGANEAMRNAVITGRAINEKNYILGLGDDWLGIMNRRARKEGERDFGIQIQWNEPEGHVSAERKWHLQDGFFIMELIIRAPFIQEILYNEKAQNFLDERLPQEYIPFFFFDGEQIQALAEANRTIQIKQIERLLNITQIDTLYEYIGRALSKWKKEVMDEAEKARLDELEKQQERAKSVQDEHREKQNEIKYDIARLEREIAQEDRYLESLRAYTYQRDEVNLKEKQKQLKDDIEERQYKIAETLPVDIPLLANSSLVRQTVEYLRKLSETQAEAQVQLIQSFIKELPRNVFDNPPYSNPPLTDSQKEFYKRRLAYILKAYLSEPEHIIEGPFSMGMKEAQELLQKISFYLQADQLRTQKAGELKDLSDRKRQLIENERKLDDVSRLSDDERQEYQQRKEANDERKRQLGANSEKLKELAEKIKEIDKEIKQKNSDIEKLKDHVKASEKARKKLELARRLQDFFWSYKEALKKQRRQAIEDAINRHHKELMSAHHLIDRIEVKEDFGLHYLDKEKASIGMASLSAGMKQLTATALLWALNEVSGKNVPLVIDTPLARIDRGHQNNLLTHYYPKAGQQVIVLPTDSELDRDKYALIAPFIYREYSLENPEGEKTNVFEKPMYFHEEAMIHG